MLALGFVIAAPKIHGQSDDILRVKHSTLTMIVNSLGNTQLLNNERQFLSSLTNNNPKFESIGLGGKYVYFRLEFADVSVWTYEGKVMQYVVDCRTFNEGKESVLEYIINKDTVLKRKVRELGSVKKRNSFSLLNEAVFARFQGKVAESLGAITFFPDRSAGYDSVYLRHYHNIMDVAYQPFSGYGHLCGLNEIDLPGRLALEYFMGRRDYTALRAILRGYNPVGRVYALEGLLTAVSTHQIVLSEDDKAVMEKVLSLDARIEFCDHCRLRKYNADSALRMNRCENLLRLIGH